MINNEDKERCRTDAIYNYYAQYKLKLKKGLNERKF